MQVTVSHDGPVTVVSIEGSVDGLTSEALQTALLEQVRAGRTRVVADFSAVSYTSSAGLRVLLAVARESRTGGGDFRLAGVKPEVRRVLDMSGFTSILKLFPTAAEAVKSFS